MSNTSNTITEYTRRNIIDGLAIDRVCWSGRLGDTAFLSRVWDLESMPSTDRRCQNALQDIGLHREHFVDWEDDWIFSDDRFDLLKTDDEIYLKFLCEMMHPIVIRDTQSPQTMLVFFNRHLAPDGWEIYQFDEISGRPMFTARRILEGATYAIKQARQIAEVLSGSYISQQIVRMESAITSDPELAIGTAKEFVETICRTILNKCSIPFAKDDDIIQLVKLTCKELKLTPDNIADTAKAAETIKKLLMNLATIARGLAELRNPYGSGHGKDAHASGLNKRHARLAVGSATTLGVFLFETYQDSHTA